MTQSPKTTEGKPAGLTFFTAGEGEGMRAGWVYAIQSKKAAVHVIADCASAADMV